MSARLTGMACAGLFLLAACTAPAVPAAGGAASVPPGGPAASAPAPGATGPTGSGAAPTRTVAAGSSTQSEPVVLSGTTIGTLPLGEAPPGKVDPVIAHRLGKAKIGRPELCRASGERTALAVVAHTWPGVTVRYGSSGGAAAAIGWTVDLAHVPDGFQLDRRLPWRPTFAALERLDGVDVRTEAGVRYAELTGERITWSAPVGAATPDTAAGGPRLSCG